MPLSIRLSLILIALALPCAVFGAGLSGVKLCPDGQSVTLDSVVVTYVARDFFYVEDQSRAAGIRVDMPGHGISGGIVGLSGVVTTNSDNERSITASVVTPVGPGTVRPLFMNNRALGGADWNYDPATGTGQKGFTGAVGLNTVGMLVRIQGVVIAGLPGDGGLVTIDDASGVYVQVMLPQGISSPGAGARIAVTGVLSTAREHQQVTGPDQPTYIDVQRRVVLGNSMNVLVAAPVWNYTGEMVSVPAGSFLMGNSGSGDDALADQAYGCYWEKPQHSVYLSAFGIGRHEVTRGEFRQFMDAGGYANRAYWSSAGWSWVTSVGRIQPSCWTAQQDWGTGPFIQMDAYPVAGVSYYEAEAFCNWAGGKLATEAQWEKAARWNDGHANVYPWGDVWDAEKCNSILDTLFPGYSTSPVGSYALGVSPWQCVDMAGSLWEWCRDAYNDYYYSSTPVTGWIDSMYLGGSASQRVLRGGSWGSDPFWCRPAARTGEDPFNDWNSLGFRIVR